MTLSILLRSPTIQLTFLSIQLAQIDRLIRAGEGGPCSWVGPHVEVCNRQSVTVIRDFLPEAASAA